MTDMNTGVNSDVLAGTALTEVEAQLVEHVASGEILTLQTIIDQDAMPSWSIAYTIHAQVVRDILLGRLAPNAGPQGIQLGGARIIGRLNLHSITARLGIHLVGCFLEEGLDATGAHLPHLRLTHCRLHHPSAPPLQGDRLIVDGSLVLDEGTQITADSTNGAIRLLDARIGGQLVCSGVTIHNGSGPALNAERCQVEDSIFLTDGFTATGNGRRGAVSLPRARVGSQLDLSKATIHNDHGPALRADSIQIEQDLILNRGFEATSSGIDGAILLRAAQVGGDLVAAGAKISSKTGPALNADELQVGHQLALRKGFTATCAAADGAIRLAQAHIRGEVTLASTIINTSGPAVALDELEADHGVLIVGRFHAAGELGTVRLSGARVGDLRCRATIRNESGPGLLADNMRVDNYLVINDLDGGETGSGVWIDLTNTRLNGTLCLSVTPPNNPERAGWLAVDGLTYARLPTEPEPEQWLDILRHATPNYAPQPYQQLAAAHRAIGHDDQARRVLIYQRRDQLRRHALTGRRERAWARLTGWTLGYGYQPSRALWLLFGISVLAVVLAWQLGARSALVHTTQTTTPGAACTAWERVEFALDTTLPLIGIRGRATCDTVGTNGHLVAVGLLVLQILAWAFATLFVAGFTGAVRKT